MKRLKEMDILRGIAILLVVVGHSFPDSNTNVFNNVQIYKYLYKIIYSFHMPLFFFISGFFAKKAYNIINIKQYFKFITKKFNRLMIPYFFITALAIPVKLIMNKYAVRPISLSSLLFSTVLYPWDNPIIFFWFLYTLFIIFCILPLILKVNKKVLFVTLIIINICPVFYGSLFNINGVIKNLIYVYLGLIFNDYYEKYVLMDKKTIIAIGSLIALVFLNFVNVNKFILPILSLGKSILGITAFINISYLIKNTQIGDIFNTLGTYSYDIYLFSWFFQTGSRVVFLQKLKFNYNIVVLLMITLGFAPILLSKLFLRKNKYTNAFFLGNKVNI